MKRSYFRSCAQGLYDQKYAVRHLDGDSVAFPVITESQRKCIGYGDVFAVVGGSYDAYICTLI